jgi:hypothetical protein
MTCSTSDVAVCCSNDSVSSAVRSLRSSVRWRSSGGLDGDDGLIGESGQKLNLFVVKRPNGNSAYKKHTDRISLAKKWQAEVSAKLA